MRGEYRVNGLRIEAVKGDFTLGRGTLLCKSRRRSFEGSVACSACSNV